MLPQQRKGWTTVVDIEEFKQMTWCYLTNVKMVWEYEGMAYLFRKAGIHLYGKDLGSMKMNHPILCMAVPQSKDKNYGVDIFVPVDKKLEAQKIIADKDALRAAAELERTEGAADHEAFNQAALAAKERNACARRARRAQARASLARKTASVLGLK